MLKNLVLSSICFLVLSCSSTPLQDAYYSLYNDYGNCLKLSIAICKLLHDRSYHDIWIIIGQPAFSEAAHANVRHGKEELYIFGTSIVDKWFEFEYQPSIKMETRPGYYYIHTDDNYAKVFMTSDGFEWFVTNVESHGIKINVFKWAKRPAHRKLFYHHELPVFLTSKHLNK